MPGRKRLMPNERKLGVLINADDLDAVNALAAQMSRETGRYVSGATLHRQAIREFLERESMQEAAE